MCVLYSDVDNDNDDNDDDVVITIKLNLIQNVKFLLIVILS